jgi:hypothetical protein
MTTVETMTAKTFPALSQNETAQPPESGLNSSDSLEFHAHVGSVSLANTDGFWELSFCGESAVLKQDQALFYLLFLLSRPGVPISAPALSLEVFRAFHQHLDFDLDFPSLPLPDQLSEIALVLQNKAKRLEAVLDSEDQLEPVKQEVSHELADLYSLQNSPDFNFHTYCESTSQLIFDNLCRLTGNLLSAKHVNGSPHPLIRAFGLHLVSHLILPSLLCDEGLMYHPPATSNPN